MPVKTTKKPKRVISISAKCSDLFNASLSENGETKGEYEGYVPDFFPGEHFGDYVILDIDVDTGVILNWRVPSATALGKTFRPAGE